MAGHVRVYVEKLCGAHIFHQMLLEICGCKQYHRMLRNDLELPTVTSIFECLKPLETGAVLMTTIHDTESHATF